MGVVGRVGEKWRVALEIYSSASERLSEAGLCFSWRMEMVSDVAQVTMESNSTSREGAGRGYATLDQR